MFPSLPGNRAHRSQYVQPAPEIGQTQPNLLARTIQQPIGLVNWHGYVVDDFVDMVEISGPIYMMERGRLRSNEPGHIRDPVATRRSFLRLSDFSKISTLLETKRQNHFHWGFVKWLNWTRTDRTGCTTNIRTGNLSAVMPTSTIRTVVSVEIPWTDHTLHQLNRLVWLATL